MAVEPWDVHPLELEIKEYFTDVNCNKTLKGIWVDVYYGMIDCGIGENIFDCLNIVYALYTFLTTQKFGAHKIPLYWQQLLKSQFQGQSEGIYGALYYLLVRSGKDERLCNLVRKFVDYDNYCHWRPFDEWENLLAKNDSVSNESVQTYEEDLQEYYNSPEGREEMEEYLENFPTEEDFELWDQQQQEREEYLREQYEIEQEVFEMEMRKLETNILQAHSEKQEEKKVDLEMSNYFISSMTADDWARLQSAWQSDESGAGHTVQCMQQLYSEGKVKRDIKQKPFYDMMNRRFGSKFTKQNFNVAIRLHDVNNVFKLKNK